MKNFTTLLLASIIALSCSRPLLPQTAPKFSPEDEKFIDTVERKAFDFFWEQADPKTGLIKDQTNDFGEDTDEFRRYRASIASVGFGLSAYIVGVENGWITKEQAYERIKTTFQTFETRLFRDSRGLYYHWIDMRTCGQWKGSEISGIDTSLFLTGAVTAGEYFNSKYHQPEFKEAAQRIYKSIIWNKLNEGGLDRYNEYIILGLLGMGGPENAMSPRIWDKMQRNLQYSTANRKNESNFPRVFYCSIFTHMFPEIWFDFRNKHDKYADYFLSSKYSVLANRQYCIDHAIGGIAEKQYQYTTYGPSSWGLGACEAPPPKGYDHYGEAEPALNDSPDSGMRGIDGTVAIYSAAGSMPYADQEGLDMMKYLYATYKDDLWGKYGFCDSYNTDPRVKDAFNNNNKTMWRAPIVSGLDQGTTLLMIENYRSGLIWKYFMKNENVLRGMKRAGFVDEAPSGGGSAQDLSGKWSFRTGDDMSWKEPALNDSAWEKITVPAAWETQGYPGYDGIAWYRVSFKPAKYLLSEPGEIILRLGGIDDADETFLNGVKLGGIGEFPPGNKTAWDIPRVYAIPKKLLKPGADNVIAVRVRDTGGNGGIWKAPVDIASLNAVQYNPFNITVTNLAPVQTESGPARLKAIAAEASSVQSKDLPQGGDFKPANAIDGNPATRWSSEFADNQWFIVELSKEAPIKKVVIDWENAAAKSYEILISADKVNWKKVYSTNDSPGGQEEIALEKPAKGKFLKLDLKTRSTEWGFSIIDMEIY